MYIPRTYAYILVQSVIYPSKKNVNRTRTRDLLHTVCRILPCTTGVHTLTLECWPILFWVYIDICIICAPGAWCRIDGAGPAAPCWARNMWQFNDLHFTQLSRLDRCCWCDLSVSSLCWNGDVLQPMLCVAYVASSYFSECSHAWVISKFPVKSQTFVPTLWKMFVEESVKKNIQKTFSTSLIFGLEKCRRAAWYTSKIISLAFSVQYRTSLQHSET